MRGQCMKTGKMAFNAQKQCTGTNAQKQTQRLKEDEEPTLQELNAFLKGSEMKK